MRQPASQFPGRDYFGYFLISDNAFFGKLCHQIAASTSYFTIHLPVNLYSNPRNFAA
jgi:hypothetical protein